MTIFEAIQNLHDLHPFHKHSCFAVLLRPRIRSSSFVRFLCFGGFNFALTSAICQLLLVLLPASISYSLSWVLGFLFVIMTYPSLVFRLDAPGKGVKIKTAIVYGSSLLVGTNLSSLLPPLSLGVRTWLLIVQILMSIQTYIVLRLILSTSARTSR